MAVAMLCSAVETMAYGEVISSERAFRLRYIGSVVLELSISASTSPVFTISPTFALTFVICPLVPKPKLALFDADERPVSAGVDDQIPLSYRWWFAMKL